MSWPNSVAAPTDGMLPMKLPKLPQLRAASPQMGMKIDPDVASPATMEGGETAQISAYARLDFDHYTFFVQTLQVVLGRKSGQEFLLSAQHSVDVHLSLKKAVSRRHAKIFYNFGTQRFELLVLGRNGAFVDDLFVAKGLTVPLHDTTKIQIGDIPFTFVLPLLEAAEAESARNPAAKLFNPTDALNLRSNIYLGTVSPKRHTQVPRTVVKREIEEKEEEEQKEPETEKNTGKDSGLNARRNSKAALVRRLSLARRKSLALSSTDEISALLKELETFSGETGQFDPELMDAEVHDHEATPNSSELTHAQLQKEEDEIDALVKQHNLSEGVVLEDDRPSLPQDLALDLTMLDQEVASLVPLINAEADAESDPEKRVQFAVDALAGTKSGISKTSSLQHLDAFDTLRILPITGKPHSIQGPRMGKPATIQPPANRIYGRAPGGQMGHILPGGIGTNTMAHMGAVQGPVPGLGAGPGMGSGSLLGSLVPPPQLPPGFAVTVPPGYPTYNAYGGGLGYAPVTRPLPPRLEVAVDTITSVPVVRLVVPFRAITVRPLAQEKPPVCVFKTAEPIDLKPKIPLRRKDAPPRRPARMQNPKDIPEQYKAKPTVTILAMISAVLRGTTPEKKGFTISEIHERIRELFPYYKYCPDGWQFPVTHNVKFNKTFTAVSKPPVPANWLYAIDHAYVEDRENIRKKQQEAAMAKAKEAALRAADYRLRAPMPPYGAHLGRPYMTTGMGPGMAADTSRFGTAASLSLSLPGTGLGLQRPKSIAEIASEIKRERDGPHSYTKTPLYFQRKPTDSTGMGTPANSRTVSDMTSTSIDSDRFQGTIKDQLAANRALKPTSLGAPIPVPQLGKPPSSAGANMLKNRPHLSKPMSSSVPVSAPKPLVSTSAPMSSPVPPAAVQKASPVLHPLPISAPGNVSGNSSAKPISSASLSMNADTKKSLSYLQKELFTLYKARSLTYNTTVTTEIITKALATTIAQVNIIGAKAGCGDNALSFLVEKAPQQVSKILDIALTKAIKEKQGASSGHNSRSQTPQPQRQQQLSAPVSKSAADSRSPTNTTTTSAPTSVSGPGSAHTTTPNRAPYVGLSKPQSFTKPGGLGRPPQFVSTKPRLPEKRPSEDTPPDGKKVVKIDD